ncbi:MAG: hypothetical protein IPM35_36980 [Myxococcales bacterium]|nr:hypothetical protein [Myxococcales bacterium]
MELVVPVLSFVFYYFVVKDIGRAARDRHDCEGNLGRSLVWGISWATLYVAPPARSGGRAVTARQWRSPLAKAPSPPPAPE